jgi:ribosomal protein S18 acetylase RimI-like enzyme
MYVKRSREPNDDPLRRVILLPGFRGGVLFRSGKEEGIIVGMIFVSAGPADVGEVEAFVNNAYRGPSAEAGWASEAKLMGGQRIDSAMLAETLADGKTTVLLMQDGCVSVEPTDEPGVWYLSMLAVDPQRQADGLGRTLLAYAEEYVKARGAERVRITVIWVRHSLIEWYLRRGYRRTGETEPFPYGDQRFGVPSRDDLYFEVFEKALAS